MKSYTIGREENSHIIISDPSKMVSRHHATLTVNGTKMTIMDHSSNGTFINGIKITSVFDPPRDDNVIIPISISENIVITRFIFLHTFGFFILSSIHSFR